jgi:hypothetical protein
LGGGLFQDLAPYDGSGGAERYWEAGRTYTLTVGAFLRGDNPPGSGRAMDVRLFYRTAEGAEANLLGSRTLTVGTDALSTSELTDYTVSWTVASGAPEVGKPIGIWFTTMAGGSGATGDWGFDNLRLERTDLSGLITSFTANPTSLHRGQSTTLRWEVDAAATVSIEPGLGDVTALTTNGIGSTAVVVPADTTFTLTATKTGQPTETRDATVTVKPLILSFTATRPSVPMGTPVGLNWSVHPVAATVTVSPDVVVSADTTFTLEVSYGTATESATVGIVATDPPTPPDYGNLVSLYERFIGHTYFPDPPFSAMQAQPDFRRFWWAGYQELAARWMAPNAFHPWLDARADAFQRAGIGVTSPDGLKSWIAMRRTFIQEALQTVDGPFKVAMSFITTESNQVLLNGAAAPWVTSISANGRALALQWTSLTNWQALLTVRAGTNVINLAGLDHAGTPISNATAQVTVVFTGTNAWPPLRINEWMADNSGFIRDPADNDREDWFELYNPTARVVDLADWSLTDTPANPARFLIPAGYTVPAGGVLLCWADGEPEQNAGNRPNLHVNFKLEKNGEAIALHAPDGTLIDAVTFGLQSADFSEGRYPDAGPTIGVMSAPTPQGSNAPPPQAPAILSITAQGSNLVLIMQATTGFGYVVEYTDHLTFPFWTPARASLTATTNTVTVTDLPLGPRQRFYRVRRSP